MRSTFMGLETNKRGLYTQQSALYTTGHNISNANTLGYSRQRVNMESTTGYPGVGLNSGTMPGFLGTGVQSGSIQRIRDSFVDQQYRQESNKLGYWESHSQAISQMEDVLNEPSHYGLQKSLSQFWQALQDLATNPNENGTRAVAVRRGEAVADSFNYMHKSLTEIQTNIGTEIEQSAEKINSILTQIAELNGQIKNVEPNGYVPNDLYDERDLLLDELSTFVPITVEYHDSGGRSVKGVAEGWAVVHMKLQDGSTVELVNGTKAGEVEINPSSLVGTNKENILVDGITVTTPDGSSKSIQHDGLAVTGKLKSLIDAYGTADGEGLYPDMIQKLNTMATAFANKFNEIYSSGYPLEGNDGPENFFDTSGPIDASTIRVSEELINKPNAFRASDVENEEGNGKIAQLLGDLQFVQLEGLGEATLENYFQGVIGDLGVEGLEANKLLSNTIVLLGAVEQRRSSISSVSLDEEMTDMIRFQQAYNASARMMTVIDETLEKIISGMGVVGR